MSLSFDFILFIIFIFNLKKNIFLDNLLAIILINLK
jgi:hypothetical protein